MPKKKSPAQLDREIAEVLSSSTKKDHLSVGGEDIPIDPIPRTIKPFELDRPYVVRHRGRLYTIVLDTRRGERVAHPAEIETRGTRSHATTKATDRYFIRIKTAPHQQWMVPSGWSWANLDEAKRGARKADKQWMTVELIDSETGKKVPY